MVNAPTISACMIVKNEETLLPKCLESIVPHVDEIVIVDTGSEDRTAQIAVSFGAKVFHHKWEDHFSRHRNQSIGYATTDWILIIDADEELCVNDGCRLKSLVGSAHDVDAVLVKVESSMKGGGKSVHNSLRLFKNDGHIRYEGRVHNELTGFRTGRHIPVRIIHHGYNLETHISEEKYKRTIRLLQMDIEDTPDHPRPHHYLGVSFLTQNEYAAAIQEAEAAIKLSEHHGYASDLYSGSYHVAATANMAVGQLDRAEQLALDALKRYPHHLDSLFNLSRIYFEKNISPSFWQYIDEYFALLEQIEKRPQDFGTMVFYTCNSKWLGYLYRACMRMNEGREDAGRKELKDAFTYCQDRALVHQLLGGYYRKKGQYSKSEAEFSWALAEAPDRYEIMWDIARLHKEQDKTMGQKQWLEALVKAAPGHEKALFALGLVYLKEASFEKAAGLFQRVLELDSGNVEAGINLAVALRKLGRHEKAVALCIQIEKDHPGHLGALSNLAHAYHGLQDWDTAMEYFGKIVEHYPDQIDAYVYMAQLCLLKEDMGACVISCERMVNLLGLDTKINLWSLRGLGHQFLSIGRKMRDMNQYHLSRICSELGNILLSSQSCPN